MSSLLQAEYAYDQGLAGVMTWSIDTDDFLGNSFSLFVSDTYYVLVVAVDLQYIYHLPR